MIEAGQEVHLKAGASLVIDAGAHLSFKAGGEHLVIQAGGIFSSRPITLGGTPSATGSASSVSVATAPEVSVVQGVIMHLAKQLGADFCPVCERCREGLCDISERAA